MKELVEIKNKLTIERTKQLIKEHRQKHAHADGNLEFLLTTEKPHPKTVHLSELAKTDLISAIETLKEVDIDALKKIETFESKLRELQETIFNNLKNDQKIFIGACG